MEQFLETTLKSADPLVLAALGGVIAFRAGIFHLGLEGLMLIGCFASVAVTVETGSVVYGVAAAVAASTAVSAIFWVVIVPLRANVIIAGLGLSGIGLGITSFVLESQYGTPSALIAPEGLPSLPSLPGPLGILDELSVMLPVTVLLVAVTWAILCRSRAGLSLRLTGEFPFAARSTGCSPARIQLLALLACGALCGLAGTDLALGSLASFSENMTAGRGYIAFSAILLGVAHPVGAAFAAVFFGAADALGVQAQLTSTAGIPKEFLLMIPYVLTLIAVWLSALWRPVRSDQSFAELRE